MTLRVLLGYYEAEYATPTERWIIVWQNRLHQKGYTSGYDILEGSSSSELLSRFKAQYTFISVVLKSISKTKATKE